MLTARLVVTTADHAASRHRHTTAVSWHWWAAHRIPVLSTRFSTTLCERPASHAGAAGSSCGYIFGRARGRVPPPHISPSTIQQSKSVVTGGAQANPASVHWIVWPNKFTMPSTAKSTTCHAAQSTPLTVYWSLWPLEPRSMLGSVNLIRQSA